MNDKQSKVRIIALAFLVCFLVVSVLSSAFILTHTDHQHDHNGTNGSCATCAQLQSAENVLKQFSTALIGAWFALAGLFVTIKTFQAIAGYVYFSTPVTQKIKMNN